MRIRIQQLKLMGIQADPDTDPDPKPWEASKIDLSISKQAQIFIQKRRQTRLAGRGVGEECYFQSELR